MRRAPRIRVSRVPIAIVLLLSPLCSPLLPDDAKPFVIHVVDEETGRGVPLVELSTTSNRRFYTDSNGVVAIREPAFTARRVFFHVRSHGYELPKDGFGIRGRALEVKPGRKAELRVRRLNVAERLYRVTGEGIYRDSVLAGLETPIREPLLNASVTGQDSVQTVVYRDKIRWFWGDTGRLSYALGRFHMTGATSKLPSRGGLDPARGVDLEYFTSEGDPFARNMAELPGEGPTWLSGFVVLGAPPRERLFAHFIKVRNTPGGGFETYERGLARCDDESERFVAVTRFAHEQPFPHGAHPLRRTVDGVDWIYFCDPYPLVRVRAEQAELRDQDAYEAFTPLATGERDPKHGKLDRDDAGTARWGWKRGTATVSPEQQERLVSSGRLKPGERRLTLRDVDSGKPIIAHRGTIAWNAYRGRWVMVFCEVYGESSMLGEIWYAEANDRPRSPEIGPWGYARKVVTHDHYSFYNPRHHPFFDADGGRLIYFEGTYTKSFSGTKVATPLYDYNQIMYRLDLDHPALALPVAIWTEGEGSDFGALEIGSKAPRRDARVAFWALDRAARVGELATQPVFARTAGDGGRLVVGGESPSPDASPLFYALAADLANAPPSTDVLFEVEGDDGSRRYTTDEGAADRGRPVCRVWSREARPRD